MLKRLTVANLAIVEKAEADFSQGLNVITGETGAGKSVLMSALDLAVGGRADPSQVREGAKEAEIEADFGEYVIRRVVSANGRSKAWVNDEAVSIGELKELGKKLVDIHGPRENQSILEDEFQLGALDAYSQVDLSKYREIWQEYRGALAELKELESEGGEEEIDLLSFQVEELGSAHLTEEDETLAERHAAAAHAGEILSSSRTITEFLGGDRGVGELVYRAQSEMRAIVRHFPEAEAWIQKTEELLIELNELSREIESRASKIEAGEEDLDELDRRLTLVNKLKRKYGAKNIAELLLKATAKREKLDRLLGKDEAIEAVKAKIGALNAKIEREAAALHKKRAKGAAALAKAVSEALHDLGFLQAEFAVELIAQEPDATGADKVVFIFAPNPGEPERPLADIASSGEIARVMLALKSILSAHDKIELLVFDEIDANIGGEVGRIVGEKMREVARFHQVIAITHLPQSAVYGEKHFVVKKRFDGERTKTSIMEVNAASRVDEIARMLGGTGKTVKQHAEELLQLSR